MHIQTQAPSRVRRIAGAAAICIAGLALAAGAVHAESVKGKDKSFLIDAAEAGNTEIAASKIALEKSQNPDIKQFAQKMIDEHTKVGAELKQVASSKDVSVPSEPSVTQR